MEQSAASTLLPTGQPGVPAVDRALDILEHLADHPHGLTLSQLSAALRLPKNAVFRITGTLRARGYIARNPVDKTFTLTRRLLTLGQPRVGDVSLVQAALAPMRDLRNQTGETVQLGIRVGDEGVIIDKVEGLHALRIAVDVGLRFPLYNNAPGKILLAHDRQDPLDATIARLDLAPHTARTITDPALLRAECDRVLANGYATDHGEADEGIHCIAAPIFDRDQLPVATLWASAPARRMPPESFPAIAQNVIAAASQITRCLHG